MLYWCGVCAVHSCVHLDLMWDVTYSKSTVHKATTRIIESVGILIGDVLNHKDSLYLHFTWYGRINPETKDNSLIRGTGGLRQKNWHVHSGACSLVALSTCGLVHFFGYKYKQMFIVCVWRVRGNKGIWNKGTFWHTGRIHTISKTGFIFCVTSHKCTSEQVNMEQPMDTRP